MTSPKAPEPPYQLSCALHPSRTGSFWKTAPGVLILALGVVLVLAVAGGVAAFAW